MFIITPSYPRRDGQSYPTPQSRFAQSFTPLIEPSVSMDNYNKQIIIWVVTFNAVSSIWRSHYLRLTLYGFPETPFSNHFKTCNPKSIKPINYKCSNIINYKLNYANKKLPLKCDRGIAGADKQKLSRSPSSINYKL